MASKQGRALPVVYTFSFIAGASEDFVGEGQVKFCQELRCLEPSLQNEGGRGEVRTVDGGELLTYIPMQSKVSGEEDSSDLMGGKAILLGFKMPELLGNLFAVVRNGEARPGHEASEQAGRAGEAPHIYQELWNGAPPLDPAVGFADGSEWTPPWVAAGRNTLEGDPATPY